ncbi:MAG: ABC transporter permease [Acidimicrobiia bacterium]|nr:ABC transporter permease [Acidimicrobiia bacterium]
MATNPIDESGVGRLQGVLAARLDWLWADTRAKIATTWLVLMVVMALFAPLLAPYDPAEQDPTRFLEGPTAEFWLGTDDVGRDILSRLIFGARASMYASFLAVFVALLIGVPVGLAAGFLEGFADNVLMRIVDTMLSFPAIVMSVGIIAALGPGLTNAMIAVGVIFSPIIARLLRGQVLASKHRLYVDAAVQFGSSPFRTITRHILPNAIQPVIVQSALLLAVAFLAEAALSFLGLANQLPNASWGGMLSKSARFLRVAPWYQIYIPGLAITFSVLAFNALGDSLRDSLDPVAATQRRLRRRMKKTSAAGGPMPVDAIDSTGSEPSVSQAEPIAGPPEPA